MSISKFTGFKTYKAPSYTVTCPQSGYQYEVRSLNVGEIARLRESILTQNRITETIIDVIWDAIQKETLPDHIKSKSEFEKYTTTQDRSAIVYGLYYITFGTDKEYELKCGYCRNTMSAKIDYSDFVSITPYPYATNMIESYKVTKIDNYESDDVMEEILEENSVHSILSSFEGKIPPNGQPEGVARTEEAFLEFFVFIDDNKEQIGMKYIDIIQKMNEIKNKKEKSVKEKTEVASKPSIDNPNDIFNKRVEVKLPISGILAILKVPTLHEERLLHNKLILNNKDQLTIASDILFIERFEEYEEGKQSPVQIISDQTDILSAYYSLPLDDRKKIVEVFEEEFGQYGLDILLKWKCQEVYCEKDNELEVDIIDQFFRALMES